MTERLPKGVRKHIREELSSTRKSGDSRTISEAERKASLLRRGAAPVNKAPTPSSLISEIEERLQTGTGTPEELAKLKIRWVWLRYVGGITNPDQRKQEYLEVLDALEKDNPKAFDWLNQTIGYDPQSLDPISRIMEIRDTTLKQFPRRQR